MEYFGDGDRPSFLSTEQQAEGFWPFGFHSGEALVSTTFQQNYQMFKDFKQPCRRSWVQKTALMKQTSEAVWFISRGRDNLIYCGLNSVISIPLKIQTFMGLREQGFLAELLGYPEEASAEVGRRRGVLREEGSEAQQAGGLPQALKVLGILGEPRAEHCAHRSAETRREMLKEGRFSTFPYWHSKLIKHSCSVGLHIL